MRQIHSIRWRLVASYVLLAMVTVSMVGLLALEIVRRSANEREVNEMQSNADAIAHQAFRLVAPVARPFELSQLVRTTAFLANMRVRILDRENNPVADSGLPGVWNDMVWIAPPQNSALFSMDSNASGLMIPLEKHLPSDYRAYLESMPPGSSLTVIRKSYGPWGGRILFDVIPPGTEKSPPAAGEAVQERSTMVVTAPIARGDELHGYVELSAGPDYGGEALATTQQAFLLAGLLAALLAALMGLLMGNLLASPLRALSGTAAVMGKGDLTVRSVIHSKDEIGELANRFNQMAERLQVSFKQLEAERDSLRRFIADASHELRTPITALKNFNDLLLGPAAGDITVQVEFLTESQVQIDRLQWITQNLLNLSRIDAGLVQLDYADEDVGDLLQAAAGPFKALAIDKGMRLVVHLPDPPLTVHCDMTRMVLVLSNLLDNAIKYTPPGGEIEMGAEASGAAIHLWVQDYGPGIQNEDLPHIFERFYRGRNAAGPGSGLGLSIVASLVQAHAGRVWAESEARQGARFVVEL